MRRYRYTQFDVFTATPFGGNQLAVLPRAEGLSDAEMQSIAREVNYSETTFVVPANDPNALCRVRIFTPASELPFAGHPVIGTTYALAHDGVISAQHQIRLELGIGTLPVDIERVNGGVSFVWMRQPLPTFTPWQGSRDALLASLALTVEDVDPSLPIERGSAGVPYVYLPLRSLRAVARARASAALRLALGEQQGEASVLLFTLERPATGADIHARMFVSELTIVEDAATGSAAGPLGVYLYRHQRVSADTRGAVRLTVEQGIEMGRASRIEIALSAEGEAIHAVRVGGQAVLVAEGELLVP